MQPSCKDDPVDRIAEIAVGTVMEWLIKALPSVIEQIVVNAYCGKRIPKGTAAKRNKRNRQICEQAGAGRTAEELAIAFHLSAGQIRRILFAAQPKVEK